MVDYDEVLIKANALENQVAAALDCHGSSNDKNCCAKLLFPSILQHLQKEKDKLEIIVWMSESFHDSPIIISYFL